MSFFKTCVTSQSSVYGILLLSLLLFSTLITQTATQNDSDWLSKDANVTLKKPRGGVQLAEGVDVSLKCNTDGAPAARITWYKNGIRVFEEDNAAYRLSDNRLKISSVTKDLNGVYSCKGENRAGETDQGESYLLNVRGEDSAFLKDDLFRKTTVTVRDSDVWIDCPFENYVSINWYRSVAISREVTNDTRARTTVFSNGTLKIQQVKRNDEDTYICEGVGRDGVSQSFTADLKIAKLGKFSSRNIEPLIDPSEPQILAKGERFEVNCIRPTGLPTPTIRWENAEGRRILAGSYIFVKGTTLIFENVEPRHTSNYTCVAENMAGVKSVKIQVQVTVPPVITEPPKPENIDEGRSGYLACSYNGTEYPWTTVEWMYNNTPISQELVDNNKINVDKRSGVLRIVRGDLSLEGYYVCIIKTKKQKPVQSLPVFVNIIKKLQFYPEPRSRSFELSSTSKLSCKARAEYAPKIYWRALPLGRRMPVGVESNNGILIFRNVSEEASGQYICTAEIEHSLFNKQSINATINVTVGISPSIILNPEDQAVYVGQTVIMNCNATGLPIPKIKWAQNDVMLNESNKHFQQLENGSLIIQSVRLRDQAKYDCVAGNLRGFKRAEMFLSVKTNITTNHTRLSAKDHEKEVEENYGIGMTKTIIIAVCSAVAYLALVIGLTIWCSIRLMKRKKKAKQEKKANLERELNGEMPQETDRLMGANIVNKGDTNGYVMTGQHTGQQLSAQAPVVIEDQNISIGSPSLKSSRSTNSSNTRPGTELMKYDRMKLQTIGVLGKGIFGDVFLAKAPDIAKGNEQLVFVKSLLSRDEPVQVEFRREVEMFNKLNHTRICRLLALCKEQEPIFMIMEYCEWGDLKQFLIATNKDGPQLTIDPPDTAQKLAMCHQVAQAMEYLASCRFVHKDLASRNILLEPNLNVKIASLGLSRDIYASEYVQAKTGLLVPLRWTSPEAWLEDDYSTKSDIWSYGCFLYEVFSGAEIPYCNLTNEQVINGYECGDIELRAGKNMPSQLQSIAYQCWSTSPRDRPDFKQIVTMYTGLHVNSSL